MTTEPKQQGNDTMNSNTGFLKSRYTTTTAFAIAALMFVLPFIEIRCNGSTFAKASGVDIALGFEMKPGKELDNWGKAFDFNSGNSTAKTQAKRERKEPNSFAMAALVMSVIGIVLSRLAFRGRAMLSVVLGILGAISLIVLLIQLKGDFKNELAKETNDYMMMNISLDFTAGFFICLLSFIVAAFFSYQHHKLRIN